MKRFWRFKRGKILLAAMAILAVGGFASWSYLSRGLPDSLIHLLDDIELPSANDRVLVFSPHPDDETIGAGGYIAEARQRGAEVRIVLVTDGNKHGKERIRYAEFKRATAKLGMQPQELVYLNYPDGKLAKEDKKTLENRLKAEMDKFSPTIILYPHPQDKHPDHSTTGKIVLAIIEENKMRAVGYQYLVHWKHFPAPRKFNLERNLLPPISLIKADREWKRFMLPEEILDRKMEATLQYRSQLRVPLLRSLLLSLVRQNEIFSVPPPNRD